MKAARGEIRLEMDTEGAGILSLPVRNAKDEVVAIVSTSMLHFFFTLLIKSDEPSC